MVLLTWQVHMFENTSMRGGYGPTLAHEVTGI